MIVSMATGTDGVDLYVLSYFIRLIIKLLVRAAYEQSEIVLLPFLQIVQFPIVMILDSTILMLDFRFVCKKWFVRI